MDQKVKALILDDNWWACVQFALDFTKPIMTMLFFVDTDKPCLGDVYHGMDTMVEKIKIFIQAWENDPTQCETLCNNLETITHHCWEKMTTPLHLLAYALCLRYDSEEVLAMPDRLAPYADEEVAKGCYKPFARLFQDDEMHKKVRLEFGLFASGAELSPIAIKDQNDFNMGAISWWYLYGQPFKNLQPLAIKILSQVASSSAVEQDWSTYSIIHSVKHNWLGSKKAEDHLCLLSRKEDHYKEGAAKLWNVTPKCTWVQRFMILLQ